jgi:multiple sugar transport system permease protein
MLRLHNRKKQEIMEAYLMLLPALIGLVFLTAGPVIGSFFISFTNWEIVRAPHWIGLSNYKELYATELFWKVLKNTLLYTLLSVPACVVFSFVLAILVNMKVKGMMWFRAIYFWPVVSSMTAIAIAWTWLYNPDTGLINYLLSFIHVRGPAWLKSTEWAMISLAIVSVWKSVGYYMVIFLAGLQSIPPDLYEASKIDGANRWHQLRHITIPLVSPTTFFVLVMAVIGSFQIFDQTVIMTKGGPAYSTLTLSFYIYENAFEWYRMGFAAAMAYVLFIIVFVFTFIQLRLQNRWVFYQ